MKLIAKRACALAVRVSLLSLLLGLAACATPRLPPLDGGDEPPKPQELTPPPTWSSGWSALKYVPNRLFDLTDVVRMQVRLGPGWALGLHATRFVPLFIGGYNTTWFGVPGPRNRAKIPLPLGLDSSGGFGIGGPEYGAAEFGLCVHLLLIGFDVGFDPRELADFAAGFAGVDLAHDDF